jgi:hypothetical protein
MLGATVGTREQRVLPAERDRADGALDGSANIMRRLHRRDCYYRMDLRHVEAEVSTPESDFTELVYETGRRLIAPYFRPATRCSDPLTYSFYRRLAQMKQTWLK